MNIWKPVATANVPPRRYGLAALLLLAFLASCGSPERPIFRGLPANVMAQPRGSIAVITLTGGTSSLTTSLRALGIPYRTIALAGVPQHDLASYHTLFYDENLLEADKELAAYGRVLDHVARRGGTLILLRQEPSLLRKATAKLPYKLYPREVDYRLVMAKPRREDPVVMAPNPITRANLDSMSMRVTQLVFGGTEARAVLATNLDAPDSSATLLWEPYERGAVWYISFPIADYAAAGREAEQKLIANLVSNK